LNSLNRFLTDRYEDIVTMSKKICRASSESEEVAHYCMAEFLEHERATELVEANRAMNFISGMIHRSFHSSTSKYHTIYRQKGRMHSLPQSYDNRQDDNIYDYEQDNATEAIQGILEDMEAGSIETWFRATLFKMYMKESNCSELARQTKIPRTSIAKAIEEAKAYIQQQLKNNNINYE
jgi:DNA-binding phage protein